MCSVYPVLAGGDAHATTEKSAIVVWAPRPRFNVAAIKDSVVGGSGCSFRIQVADSDTNPLDYGISCGVNAKGLIPGRNDDAMGIAYNYNRLRKGRFLESVGIADSSSVWEAFYNVELTSAVHVTLDAQLNDGALPNVDTAVLLGASLEILF